MWYRENAFTPSSSEKNSKREASPPPPSLSLPSRSFLKPTDQDEDEIEIANTITMDDSIKGLPASFENPIILAMPLPTKKLNQKDDLKLTKTNYAARVLVPGAANIGSATKQRNQRDDLDVRKNNNAARVLVPGAVDIF